MSWLGSSVRSQGSSPAHRRMAGWHPPIRALHAFSLMGTTVMAMLFCEVFGGRLRAFEGRQGRNAQEPELKSGSQRTLRWRKPDSNFWSLNQSSSGVLSLDAMARHIRHVRASRRPR
jgi:hypothetical protein